MGGITGIYAFNQVGGFYMINLAKSIDAMLLRGPDIRGSFVGNDLTALGFRGHSSDDNSYLTKQPFTEPSERYTIVFDGDFHNLAQQKILLEQAGYNFLTSASAEIALALYMHHGRQCLSSIEGGFALAIYDAQDKTLFLARDPFGIKPLFYYHDEDKFIFASEMKAVLTYNIPREMDAVSLMEYSELNFISGAETLLKNIYKLPPAHMVWIEHKKVTIQEYYAFNEVKGKVIALETAKTSLLYLLEKSVDSMLENQGSAGALLDGSLGASSLVHIASRNVSNFRTFSLQNRKNTKEVNAIHQLAKVFKTDHTTLYLNAEEVQEEARNFLKHLDAPFAGIETLYKTLLYKKAGTKVRAILSADASDTLLGGLGYYRLEHLLQANDGKISLFRNYEKLLGIFLKDTPFSLMHLLRQAKCSQEDRFWQQYQEADKQQLKTLWKLRVTEDAESMLKERRKQQLGARTKKMTLEAMLQATVKIALPARDLCMLDIATTVAGIKVLLPFLDKQLVEFAFSLPAALKVDGSGQSSILKDAYKTILPTSVFSAAENFSRMSNHIWMLDALRPMMMEDELIDKSFLAEQGMFDYGDVKRLTSRESGAKPGNNESILWNLLVFQHWYKKFMHK